MEPETTETRPESGLRVPPELRAAREDMRGLREVRRMPMEGLEVREVPNGHGGNDLLCSGYASTTCADRDDDSNAYVMEDMFGEYTESTVRGFATKTIQQSCDTVMLANHGGIPMARTKPGTLKLSEDLTGLYYEGRLNPSRPDVQILRAAIDDGAVSESSFAFRVTRQEWNEDYTRRWIVEVNLDRGDVSPVTFGANPHTGDHPLSMRSAVAVLNARGMTLRALAAALKEIRAGVAISQATRDVLQPILDHLAAIDEMVDADQPDLADLLGVENPDDEEQESTGEPDETEGAPVPPEMLSAPAPLILLPNHTRSASADLARLRSI